MDPWCNHGWLPSKQSVAEGSYLCAGEPFPETPPEAYVYLVKEVATADQAHNSNNTSNDPRLDLPDSPSDDLRESVTELAGLNAWHSEEHFRSMIQVGVYLKQISNEMNEKSALLASGLSHAVADYLYIRIKEPTHDNLVWISRLFEQHPELHVDANSGRGLGMTLLNEAAEGDQCVIVEYLLHHGASLTTSNVLGDTPFLT